MSTNRKIAKASLILMAVSMTGNLLSMLKEILAAKFFGISRAIDAFNSALTIPNYTTSIIVSISTLVFMPAFIKNMHEGGRESANELAGVFMNYIFLILAVLAAAVFFSTNGIIAFSFKGLNPQAQHLGANLLKILSVTMLLSGMITILTGILNSYEQFFWPSVSQIFVTLCTMFFIVFYARHWGVFVFAAGLLGGLLIQLVILLATARRFGFRFRPNLRLNHPGAVKMLKMSSVVLLLAVIGGINPFINRAMASWLPEGSIAALAFAEKLLLIPSTIISASLVTAIYPFFSMQAAGNKLDEMRHTLASSMKMSGFLYIPIAVTMIVFARPAVQVLFQRGAFDMRATQLTSTILIFLSFQLFFSYAGALMQRLIFVFQDMKVVFYLALIGTGMNVALNYIFIKTIHPPVAGIALSASAGSLISALIYFAVLKKRLSFLHGLSIIRSLASYPVLAAASGALMYFAYNFLDGAIRYSIVNQFIKIGAAACAGLAVYAAASRLFGIEEMVKIHGIAASKIRGLLQPSAQRNQ